MRRLGICLGIVGIASAAMTSVQNGQRTIVVVTGDFQGHLEPCGCTFPMSGGIQRQATLIRQLRTRGSVMVVANGATTTGNSPQDQLKAETLAEAYKSMEVSAINLATEDVKLGIGGVYAVQNNSNGRLMSGSLKGDGSLPLLGTSQSGPFLIGGLSTRPERVALPLRYQPIAIEQGVTDLVGESNQQGLVPILLLDGNEQEASEIAFKHGELRLIVYRSADPSPVSPKFVGKTYLVTPGQRGKAVVELSFDGTEFGGYQVDHLGPEIPDDPKVSKIYQHYLKRVDQSNLIDRWPRTPSLPYGTSMACQSCHGQAYRKWQHSQHATAFASLESKGHSRDPDCVSCHVVGLSALSGFRSRKTTPMLANVGCESCHGPAKLHMASPYKVKAGKAKLANCVNCHTSDQSPGFKPLTFWNRISHK